MKYFFSIALLLSSQSLFPMLSRPVGLMRTTPSAVGKRGILSMNDRQQLIEKAKKGIPHLEELDSTINDHSDRDTYVNCVSWVQGIVAVDEVQQAFEATADKIRSAKLSYGKDDALVLSDESKAWMTAHSVCEEFGCLQPLLMAAFKKRITTLRKAVEDTFIYPDSERFERYFLRLMQQQLVISPMINLADPSLIRVSSGAQLTLPNVKIGVSLMKVLQTRCIAYQSDRVLYGSYDGCAKSPTIYVNKDKPNDIRHDLLDVTADYVSSAPNKLLKAAAKLDAIYEMAKKQSFLNYPSPYICTAPNKHVQLLEHFTKDIRKAQESWERFEESAKHYDKYLED